MFWLLVFLLTTVVVIHVLCMFGRLFKTGWWFVTWLKKWYGIRPIDSESGVSYYNHKTNSLYSDQYVRSLVSETCGRIQSILLFPTLFLLSMFLSDHKEQLAEIILRVLSS